MKAKTKVRLIRMRKMMETGGKRGRGKACRQRRRGKKQNKRSGTK